MSADSELSAVLNRRQNMNERLENGESVEPKFVKVNKNVYAEFSEFTRKEIKEYEKKFKQWVPENVSYLKKRWIKSCSMRFAIWNQALITVKKDLSRKKRDFRAKSVFKSGKNEPKLRMKGCFVILKSSELPQPNNKK